MWTDLFTSPSTVFHCQNWIEISFRLSYRPRRAFSSDQLSCRPTILLTTCRHTLRDVSKYWRVHLDDEEQFEIAYTDVTSMWRCTSRSYDRSIGSHSVARILALYEAVFHRPEGHAQAVGLPIAFWRAESAFSPSADWCYTDPTRYEMLPTLRTTALTVVCLTALQLRHVKESHRSGGGWPRHSAAGL